MMLRSTGQEAAAPDLSKSELSALMRKMGSKGGKKGGKNRWASVSSEVRSKALSAAAKARQTMDTLGALLGRHAAPEICASDATSRWGFETVTNYGRGTP